MNLPNAEEEPLNNVELESAILGLRMALTPEEGQEARQKFLQILRDSHLAVPTAQPAPVGPDGTLLPGADIQLIIAEDPNQVSGVPAFTTLLGLRSALPQVEHGMFLTGAQLGGILSESPLKLFVDGPGLHAEVDNEELRAMVQEAQQIAAMQQAAAQRNEPLELALAALVEENSADRREAVAHAFMSGFCRIPVATENDNGKPTLMLSMGNNNGEGEPQNVPLLAEEGALLCFSGEETFTAWDKEGRPSLSLPGPIIAQVSQQAGLSHIHINLGSPETVDLEIADGTVTIR